ncbi:MAG: hypothetical protein HY911_08085 [Desulfobacterales bacterium]|nr:hypothetical protein [Desulfobacterales bacterium]
MKDSALEQMRQILPELFETNLKAARPGGMCTPESGCPPATDGAGTDVIGMLYKSGLALPETAAPGLAEKESRKAAWPAADPQKAEDLQP